ncbi:MAG TPA: M23 family metallopeptidase [Flavitalea sp.]|nr:M23 family metallopeptidase [Flavitalea sp.]
MLNSLCSAAQSDHSVLSLLGKQTEAMLLDDSSYAYALPYKKGKSYLLVQAYQSHFSHKGEIALDFKMHKGSKICAARSGRVVEVKQDSDRGGLKQKYLNDGNHVIILHNDGTYGNYWHLLLNGARVHVGDSVNRGDVIALSGNTGYTAFSHLHFEVTATFTPGHNQLPTRFVTRKGIRFLRPLHWYKSI